MTTRTAVLIAVSAAAGRAQQQIGVPVPPLGAGPFVFDTAEQPKVRVTVVARGLSHPWAIAFLPDGAMLIPERSGTLRIVRNGVLDPKPIAGVPRVRTDGNGGLMDVAVHPRFAENRLAYLTYTKPVDNGKGTPSLARGRLEGQALTDVKDLVVPDAYQGNGGLNGRVAFGSDGMVNVFVGSMRVGGIAGTGHLPRIVFNARTEEIRRESMLNELRQRIREVRQGPDGLLYVLTDADDGALLRLEPPS